jgi:UDP-N-acetylglucosamine 2-epimerase (non-hydrolysing)
MILFDMIVGARPNFVKIASIIDAFKKSKLYNNTIDFRLIHTGQHYDKKMSDSFFIQLNIPTPNYNLGIGSGNHAEQTGGIMIEYEKLLQSKKSNFCLVVGDVNSTLACAIVAKKNNIKVIHVEAGIRSSDESMPEEINRIITDSITDIFFTTTESASKNLLDLGVHKNKIFLVGNTMIDTLLKNIHKLSPPNIWNLQNLSSSNYFVLTLHRPSNVDSIKNLEFLIINILKFTRKHKIIFPIHPRIAKKLNFQQYKNLICIEPLEYLQFNFLIKNALGVITDSGGITEETTVLNIPCITLRDNTERPETVELGTNVLIGNNMKMLEESLNLIFEKKWKDSKIPMYWDGEASLRIMTHLENILSNDI